MHAFGAISSSPKHLLSTSEHNIQLLSFPSIRSPLSGPTKFWTGPSSRRPPTLVVHSPGGTSTSHIDHEMHIDVDMYMNIDPAPRAPPSTPTCEDPDTEMRMHSALPIRPAARIGRKRPGSEDDNAGEESRSSSPRSLPDGGMCCTSSPPAAAAFSAYNESELRETKRRIAIGSGMNNSTVYSLQRCHPHFGSTAANPA